MTAPDQAHEVLRSEAETLDRTFPNSDPGTAEARPQQVPIRAAALHGLETALEGPVAAELAALSAG